MDERSDLRKALLFCAIFFVALSSLKVQAAKITAVEVKGSIRSDFKALKKHLRSSKGKNYSLKRVQGDVKRLMDLGSFYDVKVDKSKYKSGVKLVFQVVERPIVGKITFEVKNKGVLDKIKDKLPLKRGEFFRQLDLHKSKKEIEKAYQEEGYFLVKVILEIEDVKKKNFIQVKFKIDMGRKIYVQKISLIGTKKVSDQKLKNLMLVKERGFFSFLSSSGVFVKAALDREVVVMKHHYLDKGYVDVEIGAP